MFGTSIKSEVHLFYDRASGPNAGLAGFRKQTVSGPHVCQTRIGQEYQSRFGSAVHN